MGQSAMKKPKPRVFLNSLPKAGTHLVAKCLDLLNFEQSGGLDASLVLGRGVRSKLRKYFVQAYFSDGYLVGIDTPVKLSRAYVNYMLNKANEGQYITGHVGYSTELLQHVKELGFLPVLILRDPRAVLNSFVHYVLREQHHPLHGVISAEQPVDRFRLALRGIDAGDARLQALANRCSAVDCWLRDDAVHAVRFEDLVGASGSGSDSRQVAAISALTQFLGIDDGSVDEVAKNLFGPGRATFRKGSVDSWRQELPAQVQEEAQRELGHVLKLWNYA